MPINFEKIFDKLKKDIASLAKQTFADNVKEAKKDGQHLLDLLKTQLKRYTDQLASGELTNKEFKDLILGQKAEIEMAALKRAGITLVEADKFKAAVLNLITSTLIGLV